MSFRPGDEVVVRSLNRRGRVLDLQGGRYRVAVGALVVVAGKNDLRSAEGSGPEAPRSKRDTRRKRNASLAGPEQPLRTSPPARQVRRIDLHGLTVEAAREALLQAVNAAILAGEEALEVVHGIGTGRVRDAVWHELKKLTVVRHVRPHPTNRGITIVQF
jgi:DNA mismatch repair protein MutS2